MPNMMDYLDWRGDLTLDQSGFNEVDNLVLAQLSYVDFDGIVPGLESNESLSVKEAADLFFTGHDEKEILASSSLTKMCCFVMKKMAQTERFKNLRLSQYVNRIDVEHLEQFSAINIHLDDNQVYVAYRGTDDSIVGWKEDFNMSFMAPVPAQMDAVRYLEETCGDLKGTVRVGGHSKGGNLAVYASVKCHPSIKEKITEVYNNDGPGFDKAMIASLEYQQMRCRIKTIVPQSSIVGMLLEHEEEYVIVKSSQTGIMQHDALTWEVLGRRFVYVDNLSKRSRILDATLKAWVNQMDEKQREKFVESLFCILDAANVKNIGDLSHDKWKKMSEIMKVFRSLTPENKEVLAKTIKLLFKESNRVLRNWRVQN